MLWARDDEKVYQFVGYSATVYKETSGYDVLRLDKLMEVIGPKAVTGIGLTPTLRWKPVPGAVRYEVGIDDFTPPEDPLATRRHHRTDTPNFELTEPLERDKLYGWSVSAYTEDGTRIASSHDPMFSTGRPKTLRPVNVRGIGVSTVLPTDWQQTSPGVFEYVDAEGEKSSLTFKKQPLSEVSFEADTLSIKSLPRYAGRDWEGLLLQDGQDSSLILTTEEGDSTYLVTVEGGEEQASLSVESYLDGLVPTMLRKFKIDAP